MALAEDWEEQQLKHEEPITKATKLHIIAKSAGGDPAADNMVLGCASCNADMGTTDLLRWMQQFRPTLIGSYLLTKAQLQG